MIDAKKLLEFELLVQESGLLERLSSQKQIWTVSGVRTVNGQSPDDRGDITVSSGSSLTVEDEGSSLSTAVQSIDFVGGGVTATNVGNDITVTIPTGAGGVSSITGTANQVNASAATGAVTLSTPQNIHTAATPTFAGLTISGTTNGILSEITGANSTIAGDFVVDSTVATQPALRASNDTNFAHAGSVALFRMRNATDTGSVVTIENAGSGNYLTAGWFSIDDDGANGVVTVKSKINSYSENPLVLEASFGTAGVIAGQNIQLTAGDGYSTGTGGNGGDFQMFAGNAQGSGNNAGGSLFFAVGSPTGSGAVGTFNFTGTGSTGQFDFESLTDTRVYTFPDLAGTIALTGAVQTLTNKTITLGSNTVTGTIAQFNTALTDADFATLAGAETLSNKTLTAPKFADLGFIADANGNELIVMDTVASAVPYIRVANNTTTNNPSIEADGETNVGLTLKGKGTKGVLIGNALLNTVVTLTDGATVALDASLGNVFKLTAAGNRTISAPTNAVDGQVIHIYHAASGANRTLTLTTGSAGAFRFGTDITGLTATTSGLTDWISCVYDSVDSRWDVVGYRKGY